ncbi:MAG TPA: ATP-binding protein [Usitatibacter sp.]|nr:ATP-binding protein [Usitatibacter sp.]
MTIRLLTYSLNVQADVVGARQRARQIAELLGFEGREQTRIATSVSEIARNAFRYAGGGRVEFEVEGETAPQLLVVRVSDDGPGIKHLDEVLDGTYRSTTGMGIGLIGSRRLMDRWEVHSEPGKGTTVTLGKLFPERAGLLTPLAAGKLVARLASMPHPTSIAEVQSQNAELLGALADLQEKQDKLLEMSRELEDTNRGVVALYAELDEKAAHLRHADDMKSRFLSNMSHEFRTPLNSVRALCAMLVSRVDGALTSEQETQVRFIAKAAEDLSELVNDLLDLAKIEAGKTEVRPSHFEPNELFSALRGMLRPLLVTETVDLVFEDASELPPMHTDESKVSQILRNFVSNALKFTERGSVKVRAALEEGESVVFSVTDTGIGIAPEDQQMIFEEFTQVPSALQRKVKGTGLGLPLCRRLAALLGGEVWLESEPGQGSTFSARIPLNYRGAPDEAQALAATAMQQLPHDGPWVLIVEDDEATRMLYEKYLRGSAFRPLSVPTLAAAREIVKASRPAAVILDIMLPGEEQLTWRWLADAKAADATLPVLVASDSQDERKALSLGADAYFHKPLSRDSLLTALARLVPPATAQLALIIDDDDAARYVIRRSLRQPMKFEEASDGVTGLALASRVRPGVIFLDLSMPGMSGVEVLDRLSADPATAHIPVVIVTSQDLSVDESARLRRHARAVLQKRDISVELLARTLDGIEARPPVLQ